MYVGSSTQRRLYVTQYDITINPATGAIRNVKNYSMDNWYESVPTLQANAASSLYLKDSNNQVYEITVDTSGTLTATAVSNS